MLRSRVYIRFWLIAVAALATVSACLAMLDTVNAQAQSCPSVDSSTGRVVYNIDVEEAGEYRVWTRMQAGNSHNNSVYLRVDSDCPINVGDSNVPADSWKWVDYKNGNTNDKIDISLGSGGHTLRYFGKEKNVKVDTAVLLKDSDCVPEGVDGKNCEIVPSTSDDGSDSSAGTTEPTNKPSKPTKVGDTIITVDGEQVPIDGEDEGGAFYIDDESGEKVYAEDELTEAEAAELGYLAQASSRMPWLIGLGAVVVISVGVIIYTAVRPERSHHIVAHQHRILDRIKKLFNSSHIPKDPPPPAPPASGAGGGSGPKTIYPSS